MDFPSNREIPRVNPKQAPLFISLLEDSKEIVLHAVLSHRAHRSIGVLSSNG